MVNYVTKKQVNMHDLRVRSFGVIWSRISDPRSLRSWYIKGTDESTLVTDSSVPLIYHDLSDQGSLILIQITPKERTLTKLSNGSQLDRKQTAFFGVQRNDFKKRM